MTVVVPPQASAAAPIDIVDGQVYGSDIAANAVSGSKIYDNSVTAADIDESTLVLTCPSGTTQARDLCYSESSLANWADAALACRDQHLRLPSVGEAITVDEVLNFGVPLLTDHVYSDDGALYVMTATQGGAILPHSVGSLSSYRCITTVGARP
ncbi:MAG TPA: hypothetical protein VMZ66_09645 [Aeromicrobium sp.]|nr:hypothetical protein [Aeromicrobium sp.]